MIASASYTISSISDGLTTFYRYAQNTSNTSAPTSGWSASVPTSKAGYFIWRQEGIALTFEKVSLWINPMCLTGSTGDKGNEGTPAKDFSILATPATFKLSSRGVVVETQEIGLAVTRINIGTELIAAWSVTGEANINAATGDENTVVVAKGTCPESFSVQCVIAGYAPKVMIVNGIREGEEKPMYLGVSEYPPEFYNEIEPKIAGDFYLDNNNIPQVYLGKAGGWVPYAMGMEGWESAAFEMVADSTKNEKTVPSQSIVYAWIENLVASNASIGELFARAITMGKLGVFQSEGFDEETSETGFSISGSGRAVFINAIIKGSITANRVTSDSFETFKEETSKNIVDHTTVKTAWHIPDSLLSLFSKYGKQPENFMTVGASSTFRGKNISSVGVCVARGTTILAQPANRSRSFNDNSATWTSYSIKDLVGTAYVPGQSYRVTYHVQFPGQWVKHEAWLVRNNTRTKLYNTGSHYDGDYVFFADDVLEFWGGNYAWSMFGGKTMSIESFTVYSLHAGTAPYVSQFSHGNTGWLSNTTALWKSFYIGADTIVPVGARHLRLRYATQSVAGYTSIGTHYHIKILINGVERPTVYSLGTLNSVDIQVPEGSTVRLRMYVAPTFQTEIQVDNGNDGTRTEVVTVTPSISLGSAYSVMISEKIKGLMFLYNDNTSEFLLYTGRDGSEYTEQVLLLNKSDAFPYTISPIKTRDTLTSLLSVFNDQGFVDGSVVTCAVNARPTLVINGTSFTVNRIYVYSNRIMFSTTTADIVVYDFNSNKEVYTTLSLGRVVPVTQKGENKTKHITPFETLKYSIGDRATGLLYNQVSARHGDFDIITNADNGGSLVWGAVAN